jgi:hypothetical protein
MPNEVEVDQAAQVSAEPFNRTTIVAPGGTRRLPELFILHDRQDLWNAVKAVARGRHVALALPEQVPGDGGALCLPARPLRAGARAGARDLLKLPARDWNEAAFAAAAELFDVALWPAAVTREPCPRPDAGLPGRAAPGRRRQSLGRPSGQ